MHVQLLMSFLETMQQPQTPSAAQVWPTLEQAQKDEIVATLARLIAKIADASSRVDVDTEASDE